MASTLTYQITGVSRGNGNIIQLVPVSVEYSAADNVSVGQFTVTQAASLAVPLGEITTPVLAYFYNVDSTNFVKILDNATEIARIPAGKSAFIPLPNGVDLKAQADTADCLMDYAIFESA